MSRTALAIACPCANPGPAPDLINHLGRALNGPEPVPHGVPKRVSCETPEVFLNPPYSKLTMHAQRFTERGIPMLSVHDSYIVPFGYDHFLRETMDAAFEQVIGVTNPVVSHTGDYPENLVLVEEMVASQQISDRHIRDLNLFKQFKGKGDRPEWMPVLDQFY